MQLDIDDTKKCLAQMSFHFTDGTEASCGWGILIMQLRQEVTLAADEKLITIETKAYSPEGEKLVMGRVKLTTSRESVWASDDYDGINGIVVAEDAPGPEWFLKGFYGGQSEFVHRIGPVWGK